MATLLHYSSMLSQAHSLLNYSQTFVHTWFQLDISSLLSGPIVSQQND